MEKQAFVAPEEERTFQYQDSLPPLPVPPLEKSLDKFLEAVKPFATEAEFRATSAIVQRFGAGVGKVLHQKLLQRAKSKRNWLEDWWLDTAYLEVRIPSQLNVNFGGPTPYLEHCWPLLDGTQLERTSISTWHTLQFWDLLRREKLAVHKVGNRPLDMNQFTMLFCTCKVPGVTKDTLCSYFMPESKGPCPSHLVVMCRGRTFTFDTVYDGSILTPPELLRQFTYIRETCDREPVGEGVSALTTEERTRWAKAREYLISIDPKNEAILETIQSSLFVVSLEDAKPYATPENYTPLSLEALTGDPTIRWGDKSYNCISYADGSFADAFDCGVSIYDMYKVCLCFLFYWHIFPFGAVRDLQLVSYAFTSFGKAELKKKRLHPDTFVQLALQLAYYRLHGAPGSCYETATTRQFYHGRTETMRSCTLEAQHWCRSMLDPTMDTKRKRMEAAFSKHNQLMADAQNGRGFDRHLLGLSLIAKEEGLPVPELYTDPLYFKSGGGGNFVLSTSLVGYTSSQGAVVPMVKHGYGFFYRIKDNRIAASCTAWKSCAETDAEILFRNFRASLQEMMQLAILSQL
uniref:Peroxisomal carnitine O-octanoyltransferase n=1 Tax=Scleropages formosus TaxID=113540 RepID=A0A8C9T1G5_SCLFO